MLLIYVIVKKLYVRRIHGLLNVQKFAGDYGAISNTVHPSKFSDVWESFTAKQKNEWEHLWLILLFWMIQNQRSSNLIV